jgi:hypothetical protein
VLGKTVDKVPMDSSWRMRRAWTADSWTVGMLKSPVDLGLEKMCWGDGRLNADVAEARLSRVVDLRCILVYLGVYNAACGRRCYNELWSWCYNELW